MKQMARTLFLLAASVFVAGPALAQGEPMEDVWKPLRYFVGSWEATVSGKFGKGKAERRYRFVLDDSFLHAEHTSFYEPRARYPEGEVHKELTFFSFDRATGTYLLRQFHNESIVNEYVLDHISDDGKTIVLRSRHIENFRPGWRARETYKILGPDEFLETFELAAPGKSFEVFVQNHFRRTTAPGK